MQGLRGFQWGHKPVFWARLNQALFIVGREIECRAVDAVSHATFLCGAVVENMTQMPVAPRTSHLGPDHVMAFVGIFGDGFPGGWRRKAWPAGAGIIFGGGAEQTLTAPAAQIFAWRLVIRQRAGKCALRPVFTQDVILLGCQASAPLFVG